MKYSCSLFGLTRYYCKFLSPFNRALLLTTPSSFLWKQHGHEEGIALLWKNVTMHAITNEPSRCVYMMTDIQVYWDGPRPDAANRTNGNGFVSSRDDSGAPDEEMGSQKSSSSGSYGSDDDVGCSELWLMPTDRSQVDIIYEIMRQCQEVNPDPEEILSGCDTDSNESDNEEHGGAPAANGGAPIDADEQMENLDLNDEQFEDAD